MNKTLYPTKVPTPPACMATTRQKILLGQHVTQNNVGSNALDVLSNIAKGILSIGKRA